MAAVSRGRHLVGVVIWGVFVGRGPGVSRASFLLRVSGAAMRGGCPVSRVRRGVRATLIGSYAIGVGFSHGRLNGSFAPVFCVRRRRANYPSVAARARNTAWGRPPRLI